MFLWRRGPVRGRPRRWWSQPRVAGWWSTATAACSLHRRGESRGGGRLPTCVFLSHSAVNSGAELGLVTGLSLWPASGPRAMLLLAEDGPVVERARDLGVQVLVTSD